MLRDREEMIRKYLVTFKNMLAPSLKPEVAIRTNVYPYADGVLLDMQFNLNGIDSTTINPDRNTLNQVLQEAKITIPNDVMASGDNHRMCFYGNRILSLKKYDNHLWTPKRASQVVNSIVNAIMKARENVPAN